MNEQIKSFLLLTLCSNFSLPSAFMCLESRFLFQRGENVIKTYHSPPHVPVVTGNILITIKRFTRYHLVVASNSIVTTGSLYVGTIQT